MTTVTTRSPARQPGVRAVWRFFRSPKGLLLIVLGIVTVIAMFDAGPSRGVPVVVSAMLAAALTEVAIVLWIRGEWIFPSGALLSGLIVALVLSPAEPLGVPVLTAMIAVASKYAFRTRWSNVFNPAALALVVAYFVFGGAESWWGSLPDLPAWSVLIVLAAGLFIADRVNKVPMALTYLAAFFGLFTLSAFTGDPARVAEVFRAPDVNATLFCALFMLDDPPTSPVRYADQMVFGLLAAVAGFSIFVAVGAVYYLPAGILVANAWESLRRFAERSRGTSKPVLRKPV